MQFSRMCTYLIKHVGKYKDEPTLKLTSKNTGSKFPLLSNDSRTWAKKNSGKRKNSK